MENETGLKQEIVLQRPAAIAIAEIESQIATAKQYPRDIKVFKDKLMAMANLDRETAEGCYYAVPRGGKTIDGPSVRLAEIALSCYGNCVAEADIVNEDEKYIYAMGQCRDLENNVSVRVRIRRKITNKHGKRYNDDLIAVTANAACAIALRNAIFKVVPGAYIKPVFDKVKRTAVGDAKSLSNRRAEVLERLALLGVDEVRVLHTLNRSNVDSITFEDIAKLIGLGTAVYDGDTELDTAFPMPIPEGEKASGVNGLKERMKSKKAEAKNEDAKAEPEVAPEPSDKDIETNFQLEQQEIEADNKLADEQFEKVGTDEPESIDEPDPVLGKPDKNEEQQALRYLCRACSEENEKLTAKGLCRKCLSKNILDRRTS